MKYTSTLDSLYLLLGWFLLVTALVENSNTKKILCKRLPWTKMFRLSLFSNVPPTIRFVRNGECYETVPKILKNELNWKRTIRHSDIINTHNVIRRTGLNLVPKDFKGPIIGSYDRHWSSNLAADKAIPKFKSTYEKINYLPGIIELDDKAKLSTRQKKFVEEFGEDAYPWMIPTFKIPNELDSFKEMCKSKGPKSLWVQKPPNLSRGVGIRFFHGCKILKSTNSVVQKYVENPMTILNRKLEFRKYVVVTGYDPLRIFVLNDELLKLSTRNYTRPNSLKDRCSHIPWSLECEKSAHGPLHYGHYTSSMMSHFRKAGVNITKVRKEMEDLIIKTLLLAQDKIFKESKRSLRSHYNSYNLLAFDLFIDKSKKLWLNEVNRRPAVGYFAGKNVKNVIANTLTLAGYNIPTSISEDAQSFLLKHLVFSNDHVILKEYGEGISDGKDLKNIKFDEKFYSINTTLEDEEKHKKIKSQIKSNLNLRKNDHNDFDHEILNGLTPSELRILMIAEDELGRLPFRMKRIFPTSNMSKYFQFLQNVPYNYWLFNAWEKKYGQSKETRIHGINKLEALAKKSIHLKS